MPIHNDPENDNELINQSIPVTTIARLFKELSFKDPQTRITLSTLELSSEYIKLFINEAIIRANEERIDEGDTLVQIDGIDNVTSTAKNNQETQYPTIDEIEDSMRIDDDDDSNNINIGTVNEDDDDELIDDDYFQDESDTQRQLRQAMDAVNDTTRNNNHNNNRNRTTTTTTNNNNNNNNNTDNNHADNILDSRHLAKIAGILTLDF
ncbi:hypothetical protein MEQ_06314 [Candida albicans P87]|mgnify:CR=1 FL=1|nr:hypothetical protein MG1_06372 [Candida albicans GC75]KGU00624.1 hypothetical protein MEQ_06314 [Candida albicans P87]KGU17129.1 hypothetical protein MG7_06335 [Candida albicans P34048]KGU20415.1 hypothetical protein MGK_06349 [Candida albicans P57055]KHC27886.1 hypothetical protein W5O_06367 [Candida albicans Ca6]KHC59072.1 hypothetical protein MGI_06299 [Candida albicans P75016]KHC63343.1 hypothetical protein MGS_06359 [Candida albicans P78042]